MSVIKINLGSKAALSLEALPKAELPALESCLERSCVVLKGEDAIYLEGNSEQFPGKTFAIDLCKKDLLWRLAHLSKRSEGLLRAVIGNLKEPLVADATAGLGRDALILQQAGASVLMFERNQVIWLLLKDALRRAAQDQNLGKILNNGLPELKPLGTAADFFMGMPAQSLPDVIYYDPMFPEREKSALVKKEMRVFRLLAGADEDSGEQLNLLRNCVRHYVVVKRPATAPFVGDLKPDSVIEFGNFRYDRYHAKKA